MNNRSVIVYDENPNRINLISHYITTTHPHDAVVIQKKSWQAMPDASELATCFLIILGITVREKQRHPAIGFIRNIRANGYHGHIVVHTSSGRVASLKKREGILKSKAIVVESNTINEHMSQYMAWRPDVLFLGRDTARNASIVAELQPLFSTQTARDTLHALGLLREKRPFVAIVIEPTAPTCAKISVNQVCEEAILQGTSTVIELSGSDKPSLTKTYADAVQRKKAYGSTHVFGQFKCVHPDHIVSFLEHYLLKKEGLIS